MEYNKEFDTQNEINTTVLKYLRKINDGIKEIDRTLCEYGNALNEMQTKIDTMENGIITKLLDEEVLKKYIKMQNLNEERE